MNRPLAAITGASSGIGAVFARKLAARQHDVLLVARRRDRMEPLCAELQRDHGVSANFLEADLAKPDALEAVAVRLASEPRLALLVNNAGFGTKGRFHEAPYEDQARMHRLHIDAILRLTRAALPGMVSRNSGAIINVSSVAAYVRTPGNVSYCATKAWVSAFTEGIYLEMRNLGADVAIQALCPGYTYSEFHDVLKVERSSIAGKWLWMSAEDVVEASLQALPSRRLFVIPGWQYRLLTMIVPRLPSAWRLAIEAKSPTRRDKI